MSAWNILSNLTRFLKPQSSLTGRDLQLHLDTAILYHTITPPPPSSPSTPSTPANTSHHQQQVAHLLNVSHVPPFPHQAQTIISYLTTHTKKHLSAFLQALHSQNISHELHNTLGFSLHLHASSIHNAGRGVFVNGFAPSGTLLTLYPGIAYLPSQIRHSGVQNLKNADYVISRYDGVIIDGAAQVEMDLDQVNVPQQHTQVVHPFALGHLVNHPPKGKQPNCLQFMLDIDLNHLPQHVRPLVPVTNWGPVSSMLERIENDTFRQRVPSSDAFVNKLLDHRRVRRTVALVALRDLRDEEIFMNYRFNPYASDVPEWYHDCDPDVSNRRWNPKGVIF